MELNMLPWFAETDFVFIIFWQHSNLGWQQNHTINTYSSTMQTVLGSFDQQKVPASLSLFLKSEKIPTLLYWPPAQISSHGRACTQAVLRCKNPSLPLYLIKDKIVEEHEVN
jgi:hypothetical protein